MSQPTWEHRAQRATGARPGLTPPDSGQRDSSRPDSSRRDARQRDARTRPVPGGARPAQPPPVRPRPAQPRQARSGQARSGQGQARPGASADRQPKVARDPHRGPPGLLLTGRGAVFVMLSVFFLGLLAASWLEETVIAGVAFVGGSVAAARYVRPAALLVVGITPPMLFFCALVAVKAMTSTGNVALSTVEGSVLTLAEIAPWLLAGTLATLIVAWFRGLPQCLAELRRGGPRRDHAGRRDAGTPPIRAR